MGYLPIENHGLIGNMRTAALVGIDGTIDWFCPEKFDAPSVFAAILDDERGGCFRIGPVDSEPTRKQFYWPDTNVLVTRFLCQEGVLEVVDYMPVDIDAEQQRERWLIRTVRMARGSMSVQVECQPAFNYARDSHQVSISENGAVFHSPNSALGLSSPVALATGDAGSVQAEFTLTEGEVTVFSLQLLPTDASDCAPALTFEAEQDFFERTIAYWHGWLAGCTYSGRWREIVYRSALVLKLMTYEPTGAIVAAPTCSLPEGLDSGRNWDYRYTWLRDAAFTLYGLMRIGFTEEARAFIEWLDARMHELNEDGSLQIMYTIDGEHEIEEQVLEHLSGYRDAKPVRIGNAAYKQLQLDIYGELLDSIYLHNKYAEPINYDTWRQVQIMLDWVCKNWQRKDHGVWEIRGEEQAFVYSKVMLWVALDRGIRLADKRSFPSPREQWRETRDQIYNDIMAEGWDEQLKTFTQAYGTDNLDAANLIMPLVFFVSPRDPRMIQMLEAIMRSPVQGGLTEDRLVYRYNVNSGVDGLKGDEGTFNMCTFWLVEALTRAGRLDEARHIFEHILGYANYLGLYAEQTGPHGEALGNFPQAFTHLALISAAFNLDRALKNGG